MKNWFGVETSTPKALVVDDSDVLRRLIEMCLRPAGFEVTTASSGADALAMMRGGTPDLVVLDIGLPDMSGWDVLEQIRSADASGHCKVLVLSGYDDAQAEGQRRGADAVVVKPFRNDELRAVAVELAGPRLTRDTAGASA